MQDEVVRKRQWVTQQQYLDMLGLTNLIPGPNSTELCDQRGFRARDGRGWRSRARALLSQRR
jgi:chromate transporter